MDSDQRLSETGKEKKNPCVECTKRRQKCDRKYPCSLCVSRGVTHLCRWETVPLARPAPARPPNVSTLPSSEQTIQQLLSRIASLEKALRVQNSPKSQGQTKIEPIPDTLFLNSPSGSSTLASTENTSPHTSPGPDLPPPHSRSKELCGEQEIEHQPCRLDRLQPTAYATTSALAHLSVGHHGEYIGRGSLVCALHAISTGKTSRFLYAKSTDSTSAYRESNPGLMSSSLIERVEVLIRDIPPVPLATSLLSTFFTESNWRFGIPEDWFRTACTQMWNALEYPGPHGIQINANWLSLFFAVLAYARPLSTDGQDTADDPDYSDHYFSCAMTARRIAEDDYMNKPNLSLMVSAADGTVLSCLAVPLLCSYLSQRGRVSEAWKLVGNGLRSAEAVGMHRDPGWRQWQVMSKDEKLLRRRAWWGLYIWDKMYSILLGRPQMVRKEIFDVAVPSPTEPDGTRNLFDFGQVTIIQLAALAGEALETCFSVLYPDLPPFFEIDSQLEHWEQCLPAEYQLLRDNNVISDLSPADLLIVDHQRYTLHTWYLLCRMKLHVAALTGIRESHPRPDVLECRKTCILMAIRLIRLQCDTHDAVVRFRDEHSCRQPVFPGSIWYFEGCFSLFEASVALITTLTRYPWEEKTTEADQLVNRALVVLAHVAAQEKGKRKEIARMGAEVLGSLRQESWWRKQTSGTMAPATHDATAFPPRDLPSPYSAIQPVDLGYDWFASLTYSSLFGPPSDLNITPIYGDGQIAPPPITNSMTICTKECKEA
ncbi:hypothetical protein FPV67DRAFT_1488820 [Lyophyllum atratum]|nr:hypothetical protein FPV67DRAFT_1488820 [Lyophyllum atratum]